MMGVAAPVIVAEMAEWVALGGGNSGIVGDPSHDFGFHVAADELPASDYSRWRDPNGSDGPYVDWNYACAGDFSHRNNERLRAMHRTVLERLMRGEMPMICEFIGQPWADRPVYYWARWNGVGTLQRYTGSGHDTWSHISWYRSRVDQRAHLWTPEQEDDMSVRFTVRETNGSIWLCDWVSRRAVTTVEEWKRLLAWGADGRAGKIVHLGDLPATESIAWYGTRIDDAETIVLSPEQVAQILAGVKTAAEAGAAAALPTDAEFVELSRKGAELAEDS